MDTGLEPTREIPVKEITTQTDTRDILAHCKFQGEKYNFDDIVIVDTAPILGVAEGRILASAADRVLVITRWKKTSMRAVEAAVMMLVDAKAKITGLALSQVNIRKYASTGDGDVYAYTKKFRGYYQN